jgi:hypothetical protein
MDLYYARMHEEYATRSHTYTNDMPKTFNKLMKAYYFLSKHPKFEVEFPPDGSKPPLKHPSSIGKTNLLESLEDVTNHNEESNTFMRAPSMKERPAGTEQSKCIDAIKMTQKTASMQGNSLSLQDMWLKIESAIKVTSKHMKANVENQIMANAPSPIRNAYFDNLYHFIAAEAEIRAVESENCKKTAKLKMRELELKGRSVKLKESLLNAEIEHEKSDSEERDDNQVECLKFPTVADSRSDFGHNQSRWIRLLGTGLIVEPRHLSNAEKGAGFACVHNSDNSDFMNQEKFSSIHYKKDKSYRSSQMGFA